MVVALRKESVDRNPMSVYAGCVASLVALRKESVDRNRCSYLHSNMSLESLSARRAWIEISGSTKPSARRAVALRKESVDRNFEQAG